MLSVIVLLIGILLMGAGLYDRTVFWRKKLALSDFKAELFYRFIHLVLISPGQWLPNGQDRRHRKTTLAP